MLTNCANLCIGRGCLLGSENRLHNPLTKTAQEPKDLCNMLKTEGFILFDAEDKLLHEFDLDIHGHLHSHHGMQNDVGCKKKDDRH